MTKRVSRLPREHCIVPARQLSGTREEVVAQIDELILGLTGLRQLVSLHRPTAAEAPPRKLRLVRGFLGRRFGGRVDLQFGMATGEGCNSDLTTYARWASEPS